MLPELLQIVPERNIPSKINESIKRTSFDIWFEHETARESMLTIVEVSICIRRGLG